jgi:hypothetical protein
MFCTIAGSTLVVDGGPTTNYVEFKPSRPGIKHLGQ